MLAYSDVCELQGAIQRSEACLKLEKSKMDGKLSELGILSLY
jgi:hypothetical protein